MCRKVLIRARTLIGMASMKVRRIPLRAQVARSAQAIDGGPQLFDFIESQSAVLKRAANAGLPPVGAISRQLKQRFPDQMAVMAVRQFVGTAVKSTLESAGYEVEQSGVRLAGDPVFSTGSVYKKSSDTKDIEADIFGQLVEGLSV